MQKVGRHWRFRNETIDRWLEQREGGKRWLVSRYPGLISTSVHGTYYERFLGSAVSLATIQPQRAVLGDLNPELIPTFVAIRDEPDAMAALRKCDLVAGDSEAAARMASEGDLIYADPPCTVRHNLNIQDSGALDSQPSAARRAESPG